MTINSETMILREMKPEEAQRVLALYRAQIGQTFCTWDEEYPCMENIREDGQNLFVGTDGDSVLGAISIVNVNELDALDCWTVKRGAAEIARVAVDPARQGEGIGARMLKEVLEIIKKRGYLTVHLLVAKKNLPAYRMYLRAGFTVVGECFMFDNDFYACERTL